MKLGDAPLSWALKTHKWLVCRWRNTLVFSADMQILLSTAEAACAPLIGLVCARVIPISVAVELFQTKDGVVSASRWRWVGVPDARDVNNMRFHSWAEAILGAHTWNNSGGHN